MRHPKHGLTRRSSGPAWRGPLTFGVSRPGTRRVPIGSVRDEESSGTASGSCPRLASRGILMP